MRTVCDHIDEIAAAHDPPFDPVDKSPGQLIAFFDSVATVENGLLSKNDRQAHIKWVTAVRIIGNLRKETNPNPRRQRRRRR